MNQSASSLLGTINHLIQTCKDGQAGFRDAAEHVKDTGMKTCLDECSLQRSAFAGELQTAAHGLGDHDPGDAGSVSGTLHRGWIDLKSAIAGNDTHAILSECERGEDAAVAAYKAALEEEHLPADLKEIIACQAAKIKTTHDRVKTMRDMLKA